MRDTTQTHTSTTLAGWRDYLSLMKPRVMSLVVFTAIAGWVAAPGDAPLVTGLISILAIAFGAGASGALNMAYDADIDAVMKRTRNRPVPAGRVSREEAYAFGAVTSVLAVTLLLLASNYLAAGLLAFTIVFYALVYTVWLKRSTPQNIVIGGVAGALPPAIAWAAASGSVSLGAVLLVAIIFMWTPPHFWALSLYKAGDYERAGVPMMPVVAGAKSTRRQIFAYAIILAPLGVAPSVIGLGGWIYASVSVLGGAAFLALSWRVLTSRAGESGDGDADDLYAVRKGDLAARNLFAFSILYLFAIFGALLIEHGFGQYMALPFSVLR